MTELILASQSPARMQILKAAGFNPKSIPSTVDEDAVLHPEKAESPEQYVQILSNAKATNVSDSLGQGDYLVIGADSALSFENQILGKPLEKETAIDRWKQMRGKTGELFSGQTLIDTKTGDATTSFSSTKIWFEDISDDEIHRYVDSGEPLQVAGAFTIDSLGGGFIRKIEGDYHTVVGLSLNLLREMMAELGYQYTDFWK